jgi:hypothetical protein
LKPKGEGIFWLILPSSLLPVLSIGQIYLKTIWQEKLGNVVPCNTDDMSSVGGPPKDKSIHTTNTVYNPLIQRNFSTGSADWRGPG